MGRQLFTIGYEGTQLPEFLNKLTAAGVQTLVDVRELPQSRIPGFSNKALTASLKRKSIEYVHIPELGSPRDLRHELRETGNFTAFTRGYHPNFLIERTDGRKELHEIKGGQHLQNPDTIRKHEAAKNWCSKRGMSFVVVTKA